MLVAATRSGTPIQDLRDNQVRPASLHRWTVGAFVLFVALITAGASLLLLDQLSLGLVGGALLAVAGFAVWRAWRSLGSVFAGRLIALGQGIVWFLLLIHGGLGFVFGPMGLAASALAGRAPSVAAVLLALPATFLAVSWAPALFGGSDLGEVLVVVLVLVTPAVVGISGIRQDLA